MNVFAQPDMTNTIPQSQLRERTKSSIADLLTEIQDAAREELQTLRRLVDERVAVLERAFARDQDDSAFDQIVQKLCDVAADHAAAASAQARAEAEEVAARELATARELAQADLDAVRAESAATLRLSESIRADLEHRLAHADAAAAESARALSDLRSQSEAACVAFEQRIAHAETARLEAVRARADAERIAAAARHDREVGAVSLDEARARIDTLEGELEASRERALQAKTHAEASRLELQRAADRIRVLEELYRQLDFRPPRSSPDALSAEVGAAVDHVKAALQTLTAAHGGGLIDALLASVAERFSRVVLCVVGPWGGVVLGSCGFKPPLQPQTALQVTTDSLLWRACADGRPTMLQGRDGQALSPFSGRPIVCGIAVPIATEQQSTAVLYAENPPESNGDCYVAAKIAELLVDQVRHRLRIKTTGPTRRPRRYSASRRARRVKVSGSIAVAIDDAHSTLIDISAHGAQVLSSRAIHPDSAVRLVLPSDKGGLSCNARVVWVVVEQAQDETGARYRAGLQFMDIDTPQLEAFMSRHGILELAKPATATRLVTTAAHGALPASGE